MIHLVDLPAVNATLNATSAVFLVAGYVMIRRRRIAAHAACMIVALTVSVVFLVSYLTYHIQVGTIHFQGRGWIRPVYFIILLTHEPLALATALVLAPLTVIQAARRRFDRHKAIARWTWPIWLYVSVTGVLIYFMLYRWYAHV
jgi:putative membrane protein